MDDLLATIASQVLDKHGECLDRAALAAAMSAVCDALADHGRVPSLRRDHIEHEAWSPVRQIAAAIIGNDDAWLRDPAQHLGELYQRVWQRSRHERRAAGCYYSPRSLVNTVLDATLDPLLDRVANEPDRTAALLKLRVIDPACGSGRFLIAAARRLASRLDAWRNESRSTPDTAAAALRDVLQHCIYGIDCDPIAIDLCRWSLEWEAWHSPNSSRVGHTRAAGVPAEHVVVGDSLMQAWPQDGSIDGGYDAIIGNPPFVNMIDGGVSATMKESLHHAAHHLTGTADLAYHFVARAHALARPHGLVGFILPKAFLHAPSANGLRSVLVRERPPSAIIVPDVDKSFRGAATYVCAVVLGGEQPCRVALGNHERRHHWSSDDPQANANWWRAVSTDPVRSTFSPTRRTPTLGEHFTITAGMTTGEAYAIREHLVDDPTASELRLITSRLIDPGRCRWGETPCRYLGQHFTHPALSAEAVLSPSLQRRVRSAYRPKLLVATLANQLEAYVDARGRDLGAVSTLLVFHADDQIAELMRLCDWLHSPSANDWLRAEIGAASVGHGYMTLTKRVLARLPLGDELAKIAA